MMRTLRRDESLGKDAIIVYNGRNYAVLHLAEYSRMVASLEGQAKLNFDVTRQKWTRADVKQRLLALVQIYRLQLHSFLEELI